MSQVDNAFVNRAGNADRGPACFADSSKDRVVFRPISGDDATLQFSAVWGPGNDNPALRRFLSLARTLAKAKRQRPNSATPRNSPRSFAIGGISGLFAFLGALARRLGLST
jgi:hypothetical protein